MPSQSHQLDDVDLYYTDAYDIRILHNNHKKDVGGEKYLSNCDLVRENYVNKSNQSLCSCSNIVEPVTNPGDTHNSSYELSFSECPGNYPKTHLTQHSSYIDIASIPPPPMPLNRKPSIRSQISPQKQHKSSAAKSIPCNTASFLNCVNNRMQKINAQFNCSDTSTTANTMNINPTIANTTNTTTTTIPNNKQTNQHSNNNKQTQKIDLVENQPPKPKLSQLNWISYPVTDPASVYQKSTELDEFFYQNDPLPYYNTDYHIPAKYNTIGSSKYYHNACELNKYPAACAFNDSHTDNSTQQQQQQQQHHQHHKSSNDSLLDGRYFSNSLTNFNYPSLQQRHFADPYSSPYTQFCNADPDIAMVDDHQYHSNLSIKQPDQQQQQQFGGPIPWRHRNCPSVGSNSSGTSFTKWDASRHWLAVTLIVLIAGAASVAVPLALRVSAEAPYEERLHAATQLLTTVPLIDGHNDLPWNIRKFVHNQLNDFNFDVDLKTVPPWSKSHWSHTDLIRLKKGQVSAQFWAAYVPCEAQYRDAVQLTLEQIDVIIRLTEKYYPQLITCTSALDILEAHKNHQLCSLTGVEGGHSLGGSLSVLRTFYALGVRYMTLTSTCHTPWADSSYADAPKYEVKHGGLTEFGKTIIREMNRLGMIVDLSHVSIGTMRDALAVSEAPVIFSHSSAYELCNSSRNVQDSILQLIVKNRGLVMINFYSKFLSCSENATVQNAVDHLNHIKLVAGVDHVGLGAGFDGINFTPKGLEDVSTYPTLFAELLGYGWTMDELTKLAGQNFLRVLEEVEMVRDRKRNEGTKPYEEILNVRLDDVYNCTSS